MHRFKDDPEWGQLLLRFRNGEVTEEDIDRINERIISLFTQLPDDIKYACFFNRDRDAINAALFEERCKRLYERTGSTADSIMIFSDNIFVREGSKRYVPFTNSNKFWEGCGEDHVKTEQRTGRRDPVLKLYHSCRVMLPCNKDVPKGQANGTQAILKRLY